MSAMILPERCDRAAAEALLPELAAAAGAVGVQLGGAAAPGVTPDRSKTFTTGGEAGVADALGSTAGAYAQPGHLHSVVGLVWRSVVLWMLLVALLSLANVLG